MRYLIIALTTLLSFQTFSQVHEFTLKNGLKVLVKEDHRAPIVVSMIWYKVGSADEQGGLTGLSHAMEHLMFKGTPQYPLGEFSKTIAALGGQENAFTSNDYTAYFEKMGASQLAVAFKMEADRMNHLNFDESEFAKEIKVIQEERRLRTDDNPQALLFERFLATAHLSEAYHHPVIGWMSDLKQMQVGDLKTWYQRYYAPNNATLVVVGDVNSKQVEALAQNYFSQIPAKRLVKRKEQKEPPVLGQKKVLVEAPSKLPMLIMGYSVPSLRTAKNPWEPYALELIASILDAGESARFSKNLIRTSQVATGVEAHYNLHSHYATQFMVYGAPSQQHSIKALKKALLAELEALKQTPVSAKELDRVKNQIIAQKTFEKDSIFGQAMELGLLETTGIGWQAASRYEDAIKQVTPEQIQQTAIRYFQTNNRTDGELKPEVKA